MRVARNIALICVTQPSVTTLTTIKGEHDLAKYTSSSKAKEIYMKVGKIMHKGVVTVSPGTPVKAIAKAMRDKDIGAIPVAKRNQLLGIVTDRDITCRGLANGVAIEKLTARDLMSTDIVCCQDDDDITQAMKLMKRKKVRRLPVLTAQKQLAGMLTLGDLTQAIKPKQSRRMLRALAAHHTR